MSRNKGYGGPRCIDWRPGLLLFVRVPRSRLYARALEEFLTRAENHALLLDLNQAYADFPDDEEEATLQGIRPLQQRCLDRLADILRGIRLVLDPRRKPAAPC